MKRRLVLIIFVIIIISLYFYRLDKYLPQPFIDEPSCGYNAFCIFHNLRDEYNKFLPLHFKAFGEYKYPIFIYSLALPVGLIDLNLKVIRAVAVIWGLLGLLAAYFFSRELLQNEKLAFLAVIFLSLSPGYFILSRLAFELITFPFFYFIGLYYLFKTIKDERYSIRAGIFLGLTFYCYGISRINTPLTIIFFFLLFRKELTKRKIIKVLIPFFIVIIPSLIHTIRGPGLRRFDDISIANYLHINYGIYEINFKYVYFLVKTFIGNYLSHLSPSFLFFKGAHKYALESVLHFGVENKVYFIFFLLGLIYIFYKREKRAIFSLMIFLSSFLLPSITFGDIPNFRRALSIYPFIEFIIIYGLNLFINLFNREKKFYFIAYKSIIIGIFILAFIEYFSFFYFTFFKLKEERLGIYVNETKAFSKIIYDLEPKYDKIGLPEPYYIFILFYNKISLNYYLKNLKNKFIIINSEEGWNELLNDKEKNKLVWVNPSNYRYIQANKLKVLYKYKLKNYFNIFKKIFDSQTLNYLNDFISNLCGGDRDTFAVIAKLNLDTK